MDLIGFVIAFGTAAIYAIGAWRSAPRVLVRLANANALHAKLHHPDGEWAFSVSTSRKHAVLLTQVTLQHDSEFLVFHGSPPFDSVPSANGVALTWKGSERLQRGEFVLFPLRYQSKVPVDCALMSVSVVVTLLPEEWRFPWSMFNLQPKKRTFHFRLTTGPEIPPEWSIRVGPNEGLKIMASGAPQSITLEGVEDVKFTCLSEDGTYSINRIKKG